jgi:DNA-binding response OmpR family regulator
MALVAAPSKKEKILIIESSGAFGERVRDALAADGYRAVLVKNAQEGLRAIVDELPHLVIMDVALAGADCYDILEKKQAEKMLEKIPAMLVSAEACPVNMQRIPKTCPTDFLISPHVDPREVLARVNRRFGYTTKEHPVANPAHKKLLWIESDKLISRILSQKLADEGFDVFHAKNGEEGMEVLREIIPDGIMLELALPGKDGFEVMKQIREDRSLSRVPVMVLSNMSRQGDIDRATMLGARKFLVKASVAPDEIVRAIRSIVR